MLIEDFCIYSQSVQVFFIFLVIRVPRQVQVGEVNLSTEPLGMTVSIRPSTGAKPLYTLIAADTIHLIVVVAIVLLNLYVATSASYQIPHFILSKHSPDAATSIYGEADLIAPHGLPFYNRAFGR